MKKGIDKKSIFSKILFPMMLVTFLQTVVFCSLIVFGGTVSHLNENSADMLKERAEHCARNLQSDMLTRWGNMEVFLSVFNRTYQDFLEKNAIDEKSFNQDTKWQKQFLAEIAPDLIQLLRQNKVNGVFLILNGEDGTEIPKKDEIQVKQGLNIRDLDQDAGYLGNDDLFLDVSPASINEQLGIPLDSNWMGSYTFTAESSADFYYKPLSAAKQYPDGDWEDQGYWTPLYKRQKNDVSMISYSIPLLASNGEIVGVVGIEIMESYLKKLLPYAELSDSGAGEYVIALENEGGIYELITTMGYPYHKDSGLDKTIQFTDIIRDECQKLLTEEKIEVYASINHLNLYSNNTLFEKERWAVIGLLKKEELYRFSFDIEKALFTSTAITMLIALGAVFLVSHRFADPIQNLSDIVEKVKPGEKLSLKRTKITEIDQFVEKIEKLQNDVLKSNQKLSMIIHLAEIPISAFEIDLEQKTVFCTDDFFAILGYQMEKEESKRLHEYEYFIQKLMEQNEKIIEHETDETKEVVLYQFTDREGNKKWARMQALFFENKVIGTILDVTKDYIERMKLQHERDHDLLTNLYNRRAFRIKMEELFENKDTLGIAAMLMIDLDNLKYVNDSYGHDYGDEYIKEAATALEECIDEHTFVSRMSGDEFMVFLYRYETKEEAEFKLNSIQTHARQKYIELKGEKMPIRMSGGIAWYPKDAENYSDLMHYADFAMYQSKRSTKGEFHEFDRIEYERDSFLLTNRGELNRLLEEERVTYYFQPIVDMKDGSIYAYEALMRPQSELIRRPDELLLLAKTQGRLYHVEKLTWKKALSSFRENQKTISDSCRIFINSISSQVLSDQDFREIEEQNRDILPRIVMELTEEERLSNEFTERKLLFIEKWGAQLALDDFGSGYNGENLLLSLNPNFVKVDMNIIRNIDKDKDRQMVFQNLLKYTKSRNIKVIAEGVETEEEFHYVKEGGADYIQGYLTGRPQPKPEPIKEEIKALFLEEK